MTIDPMDPKLFTDAAGSIASRGDVETLKELAEGGVQNFERVATKFESLLLSFLIKQMWESVERSGLIDEAPGRSVYDGFISTYMADHLAENGGIGIAKHLVTQLEKAAQAYERQANNTDLYGPEAEKD